MQEMPVTTNRFVGSIGDVVSDGTGEAGGTRRARSLPVADTVLIVDDDEAVLAVAAKILSRGGYEVTSAAGGTYALAKVDAVEGGISILLTDMVMPGMNGRELGDEFTMRYPDVPILFMSAYTADEVLLRGLRLSDVNYIAKPFTVEGLRAKVRSVIDGAIG
ncbi:MAG: response regulator [Gemmatimonadetes bacterium]|jgi:CheY-like chemotaxis protein|nr:response regulator [Gemmatimonadota bacterium]